METIATADAHRALRMDDTSTTPRRAASAVSWGAIFAGAIAAAALSMILLMLGVGLGLSSVSPWASEGVSAATFGISTIVWLTLTQLLASGMGGYLAGRLRTRWSHSAADEVYFRDTAHGFLAWAVASLATAALLSSAVSGIVSGSAQAGVTVAATAAASPSAAGTVGALSGAPTEPSAGATTPSADPAVEHLGYAVDAMFRSATVPAAPAEAATTLAGAGTGAMQGASASSAGPNASAPEVTRILGHSLRTGELSASDSRYVAQLVAQRTGLSQAQAEQRVSEGYARLTESMRQARDNAKQAADKARKATAYTTLWMFISLLIGAFVASLLATFGGRQRDAAPLPL